MNKGCTARHCLHTNSHGWGIVSTAERDAYDYGNFALSGDMTGTGKHRERV